MRTRYEIGVTMEASNSKSPEDRGRAALIVAHPGHELRVFHWMELHQPLYFCITDGSGGAGASRVASTTHVLERTGATPGAILGRHADKEIYRLLLEGRVEVFVGLTRELAQILSSCGVTCVTGDAVEGFNPTHDVCRFIIDGAVGMVRQQTGRTLRNFEFVLDAAPDAGAEPFSNDAMRFQLDEAAVERKVAAALDYSELRDEVDMALSRFGKQAFALEVLRPANTKKMIEGFEAEPPAYERLGEARRKEGRYTELIRYHPHVLPVLEAIEKAVRESSPSLPEKPTAIQQEVCL